MTQLYADDLSLFFACVLSTSEVGSQINMDKVRAFCKMEDPEEIKTRDDCAILQDDLNCLAAWGMNWGMTFHPEKYSAIRVTRSRNPISSGYTLKGHTLDMEDSIKYLGVELQSNMAWNRHMDQTIKKANSTLRFLRRNLRVSNEETKSTAYYSMVRPILFLSFCLYVLTSVEDIRRGSVYKYKRGC